MRQASFPTASAVVPRSSATLRATSTTKAGSFLFPRNGTGARKGLSVSTSSRSRGMRRTASRIGYGGGALFAIFVGFGRLYLGVHWPTDVLAGWFLGFLESGALVACELRRSRDLQTG